MLKLLEALLHKRIVTEDLDLIGHKRLRGRLLCTRNCGNCGECVRACPVEALSLADGVPQVDYHKCRFCGLCVAACEAGNLHHGRQDVLAQFTADGREVAAKITARRGRSLHVRHVNAGGCNACDGEVQALLGPIYDLRHYGITFVSATQQADLLFVTGCVTRAMREPLRLAYAALAEPKLVLSCGACACSGALYGAGYALDAAVQEVIPVDISLPGCPPRPAAMLLALCAAADLLEERLSGKQ